MLDFRVATFLSVCETLNYTRTAERLSISQPAVSQHIAQLERQLGAKLFERRGKRLELTAAGRAARAVAETMAHDEHLLKEEVRSRSHDEAPLVVGATLTAGEYLVSEPLARYLAAQPNARVDVVQGDTQRLIAQLRAGAIDCAFVEGVFDSAAFAARTFARQKLVGVCAPGAAVARRFDGSVTSLLGERLIAREPHELAGHWHPADNIRRATCGRQFGAVGNAHPPVVHEKIDRLCPGTPNLISYIKLIEAPGEFLDFIQAFLELHSSGHKLVFRQGSAAVQPAAVVVVENNNLISC